MTAHAPILAIVVLAAAALLAPGCGGKPESAPPPSLSTAPARPAGASAEKPLPAGSRGAGAAIRPGGVSPAGGQAPPPAPADPRAIQKLADEARKAAAQAEAAQGAAERSAKAASTLVEQAVKAGEESDVQKYVKIVMDARDAAASAAAKAQEAAAAAAGAADKARAAAGASPENPIVVFSLQQCDLAVQRAKAAAREAERYAARARLTAEGLAARQPAPATPPAKEPAPTQAPSALAPLQAAPADRETLIEQGFRIESVEPTEKPGGALVYRVGAASGFVKLPKAAEGLKSLRLTQDGPGALKIAAPMASGLGERMLATCRLKTDGSHRMLECTPADQQEGGDSMKWLVVEVADMAAQRIFQCARGRPAGQAAAFALGYDSDLKWLRPKPAAVAYPWPELLAVVCKDPRGDIRSPLSAAPRLRVDLGWKEGGQSVAFAVSVERQADQALAFAPVLDQDREIESAAARLLKDRQILESDSDWRRVKSAMDEVAKVEQTIRQREAEKARATSDNVGFELSRKIFACQQELTYRKKMLERERQQFATTSRNGPVGEDLFHLQKSLKALLEAPVKALAARTPTQVLDPWGIPVMTLEFEFRTCDPEAVIAAIQAGKLQPRPEAPAPPAKPPVKAPAVSAFKALFDDTTWKASYAGTEAYVRFNRNGTFHYTADKLRGAEEVSFPAAPQGTWQVKGSVLVLLWNEGDYGHRYLIQQGQEALTGTWTKRYGEKGPVTIEKMP